MGQFGRRQVDPIHPHGCSSLNWDTQLVGFHHRCCAVMSSPRSACTTECTIEGTEDLQIRGRWLSKQRQAGDQARLVLAVCGTCWTHKVKRTPCRLHPRHVDRDLRHVRDTLASKATRVGGHGERRRTAGFGPDGRGSSFDVQRLRAKWKVFWGNTSESFRLGKHIRPTLRQNMESHCAFDESPVCVPSMRGLGPITKADHSDRSTRRHMQSSRGSACEERTCLLLMWLHVTWVGLFIFSTNPRPTRNVVILQVVRLESGRQANQAGK